MDKFRFEHGPHFMTLYRGDAVMAYVIPEELPSLASCVSSALAEQNSRVMGGASDKCCDGPARAKTVCTSYLNDCDCCQPPVCSRCGHPRACHSTQSADQAPSTRTEG